LDAIYSCGGRHFVCTDDDYVQVLQARATIDALVDETAKQLEQRFNVRTDLLL
jgi:hypothetical protein